MWNNMPIVTPSLLPRQMFASLYKGRNEGKEIRRFSKFSVLVNRLAGRTFLLYRLIKFYEPTISAFPAVCSQKSFFRHEVNWHYSKSDSTQPWLSNHLFPLHTHHRVPSSFLSLYKLWSLTPLLFRSSFGLFLELWPFTRRLKCEIQ